MSKFDFEFTNKDGAAGSYVIDGDLNGDWCIKFLESGTLNILSGDTQVDLFLCGGGDSGYNGRYWYDRHNDIGYGGGGRGGDGGYRLTKRGVLVDGLKKYTITVGVASGSTASHIAGTQSGAFGYMSDDNGSDYSSGGIGWYQPEGAIPHPGKDGGYAFGDSKQGPDAGYRYGAGGGGSGGYRYYPSTNKIAVALGALGGADGAGDGGDGEKWAEVSTGTDATAHSGSGGGGGGKQTDGSSSVGLGADGVVMIRNARSTPTSYVLTVQKDTGCNVSVVKTKAAEGNTGVVHSGQRIYNGDELKITLTPLANYKLIKTLVNGTTFVSGNTHKVNGNVLVEVESKPLAAEIVATDANVEEATTINIKRVASWYTYDLIYSFGEASGDIVKNYNKDSYVWTIPTSFYSQFPNDKSKPCTITCKTYDNGRFLGSHDCSINISADYNINKPDIICNIHDIDTLTSYLTGDSSVLIRNRSNPECKITATPKNYATISKLRIGKDEVSDGRVEWTKVYEDFSGSSVEFEAVDSRGFSASKVLTPSVISYVSLSCYANLKRPSPTSNDIELDVHGDFYNGSFGAHSNTLMLDFRYRENTTSSQYSAWYEIPQTKIIKGVATYITDGTISLLGVLNDGVGFDYKKTYVIQIRARDGVSGHILSTSVASETGSDGVIVNRGFPVFDWGKDDFNFNVPVNINDPRGLTLQGRPLNTSDIVNDSGYIKISEVSSEFVGILRATDWLSSGNYFTQTLNLGVTGLGSAIVDINFEEIDTDLSEIINEWSNVLKASVTPGKIVFISAKAMELDIPVKAMEVYR